MSRPLLESTDLQTILAAQPPSAALGDLLWIVAGPDAARPIYEAAWAAGEAEALVALAILDHVSHIPHGQAPLSKRAESILSRVDAGRLDEPTATELLRFLVFLAAFRLHDYDESTRLAVLGARRLDVLPLPFQGLEGADVPATAWQRCLDALLERAQRALAERDRNRLLLTAAMLGAELGRTDPAWCERLIRTARSRSDEIFVFLLLRLLDRVDADPSELSRTDLEQYLGPLWQRLADPEERFAYRLRQLDVLAKRGAAPKAIEGLRELAEGPAVDGRAAALERCQRMAVCANLLDVAAEMATTRARRSADPQLKVALWLQAEELVRLARGTPMRLLEGARELAGFARRQGRVAPGLLDHTYRVIEAAALQAGQENQLTAVWDERELVAGTTDQTIRRILFRRAGDDLLPEPSEAAALLGRLGPGLAPLTARTALCLVLVGRGWGALATELLPERLPEPLRQHGARLKAYALCFHRDQPTAALAAFESLLQAGDEHPGSLWGLWMAAHRAGELTSFRRIFAERALAATDLGKKALYAALEVAALGETGRVERGLELARVLAGQRPGDAAAALLETRLAELGARPTPLDIDHLAAVRPELGKTPNVDGLVARAEVHIERGEAAAGAASLEAAARQIGPEKPHLAAALLVRAGGLLGALGANPPEAERLLRRAFELQPASAAAWSSLVSLYSRTGQHRRVAEMLGQAPHVDGLLPVDDLRRSARALREEHPEPATQVYRLLLQTASTRPADDALGQDLEDLHEIMRRTGRASAFRDQLESLVVTTPSEDVRGELNYRLGALYAEELRDVDLAVEHLRRALNAPAARERASRRLRALLHEQQRWEELVEVLLASAEFVRDDAERVEVLMSAAEAQWDRLNRPTAAAQALEQLLATDPKHLRALLRLAAFKRTTEEWEVVVDLLERAARLVEDKRERSQVYQQLGEVYQLHLDKANLALEHYLVSFMCDGANRETFDRLERLYTAMHRHKELVGILNIAIETSKKATEGSPFNLEELYARRAHVEFKYLKDPAQAADSLLQALRINPGNSRYLRLIEAHLLDAANPDTILEAYEVHARALPPGSAEVPELIRAQAAVCERLPDRRRQAVQYYSRLLEIDPSDKSAFSRLESYHRDHQQWDDVIALYRGQLRWVNKPEQTVSLHHKIARIYETEKRDLQAAADTYAHLLELVPASISALRGLGRLYEATRNWDALIDVSEREVKLVEDDRVRAHLLFKIGSIYETHRGDEDQAIGYYERAVEHDPRCVPALHGLRDIFQRKNDPQRVIQFLEREALVWDNPRERASIHTRVAEVYWEGLKDAAQAIEHLKRALSLVPDSAPALHRLLDITFAQGAWADAAPIAYSLSQHPESMQAERRAELFLRRGVIAYHLGNRREAIESLKIALDIAPDHAAAFERLSDILNEEGDADAHAEFFARLQKEFADRGDAPGLARVKRFLGRQAENRRNLAEAARAYDEAIERDRDSVAGLRDLVRVHVRLRHFEAALQACHRFARGTANLEARRDAEVVAAQVLLDHLGRRGEAREKLQAVLAADPAHSEALFLGAQAAYLDADWATARRLMEALIALEAQQAERVPKAVRAEHLFYLGRILETGFQNADEALNLYARAREEYPLDVRSLKAAALLLHKQQNWLRLDGLLDRALRGLAALGGESVTPPVLLFAARLSRLRQQPEKAQAYLKRLLEIEPSHAAARTLLVELVQTARSGGEDAARELWDLLQSNVFDVDALAGLAGIHEQRRQHEEAAALRQVLALLGDSRAGSQERAVHQPDLRPLGQAGVLPHIHPPVLQTGYLAALDLLGPHLPALGLARPVALPSRSQRLQPEEGQELRRIVAAVLQARPVGTGSLELYGEGPRGTAVTPFVAERPAVVLEIAAEPATPPERLEACFIAAHAADLLASGSYAVLSAPRSDLTQVLWWLSRWSQRPTGDPPGDEAPWLPHLSAPLRHGLQQLFQRPDLRFERLTDPQHAQRLVIALEEAAVTGADHVALLLCNDLRAAASAILRLETGMGLEAAADPRAELARSRRLRRLVQYAISEDCLAARRARAQ